jgi:hypothetical protein
MRRGRPLKGLRDAARFLVGGVPESDFAIDEDVLRDLQALGASPEVVAQWREQMVAAVAAEERSDVLEVNEDYVDSVKVFEAMLTQWDRAGADGVRVGLNYGRVPIAMRGVRIDPDDAEIFARTFADLRVMEDEALLIFAERSARQ